MLKGTTLLIETKAGRGVGTTLPSDLARRKPDGQAGRSIRVNLWLIGYHVSTVSRSEPSRDSRLYIHNLVKRDPLTGFAEDVRKGLTAHPKRFLPKYFYD